MLIIQNTNIFSKENYDNKKFNKFLKYTIIYFETLILLNFIIHPKKTISKNKTKINISIKKNIYNLVYKFSKKKLIFIDSLYIRGIMRFGNSLLSLNNAIIFCELFKCKRIIIKKNKNIFIKHSIYYLKYNLTIIPHYKNNYKNNNSITLNLMFFYYLNFSLIGKVDRIYLFRQEIMKYLPKVKINSHDLFIYIRGGDIFRIINKSHKDYHQPPLCFYESVLNNFKFRKISIISEDKLNPVIPSLIKKYPYIRYNKSNFALDISNLVNSYNTISAVSSFLTTINKLNHNLKFLWEYDYCKSRIRYLHLHYSVYTFSFNYTIYKMKASENYKKIMNPFINSEKQRKMMIEENCDNIFYLVPPRIS